MTAQDHTDPLSADVVIVGAGMAGLYTAWRLLKQNPSRRIRLLERLPRTGGRLETDHVLIAASASRRRKGGCAF
jgi:Protoporphyrinogen oxidase